MQNAMRKYTPRKPLIMNFQNIPEELKRLPQWVVWRSVIRDGDVTKPPFCPGRPDLPAKVNDPSTWGTFEAALRSMEENPSLVQGIGFVFTEQDEYFGIDIDDERKVPPQFLEERRNIVSYILGNLDSYTERSPSGNGLHVICKGRSNVPGLKGRRSKAFKFEIYCAERYFTVTGDVYNGRMRITDQQSFLDDAFRHAVVPDQLEALEDTAYLRSTELNDEEALKRASEYHPNFMTRYSGQVDCQPGEWSSTFTMIVGVLDNVSGNVDQVRRLVMQSPMVMISPPAPNGEGRVAKAQRIFDNVLRLVRQNNTSLKYFVEHGRKVYEAMVRHQNELAAKATEELRLTLEKAEQAIGQLSAGSASILDAFPQLTTEHKILTVPPGVVGQYVVATSKASYKPFVKFAIPATFAALAGVVGRRYKLPGGKGINLNFIMAAPSNSGKTMTMNAWQGLMNEANDLSAGQVKSRIVNSSTSSIQAILDRFAETPSSAWFIEECHSQLTAMSQCRSPVEAQLRDGYNQLYDCAMHGYHYSGPLSRTNTKNGFTPINNLSVSTFWTTTPSKFDIFTGDALDGFMSRVIVIRHDDRGGDPVQYVESFPQHLVQLLSQHLTQAKVLDETYESDDRAARDLLVAIDTSGIRDLMWSFVQIVDRIANAAIAKELPPVYGAVSRLPITAQRMAAVMAVMDNPHFPVVTEEQYKWAFGYLLQNTLALLSDMDKGEVGEASNDDTLAVVRTVKEMLRQPQYKQMTGIPKTHLRERLRSRKPFNIASGYMAPGTRIGNALTSMIADGMLLEQQHTSGKKGRPVILLSPNMDDPVWTK